MAYSTNSQVAGEFKNISFSASTPVTDTEVDRFIEEIDQYIDSRIGKKYEVPVTGSASIIILRQISIWLVADRVKKILEIKNVNSKAVAQGVRPGLYEEAMEMLDDIVDGDLLLPDATLLSSGDGFDSYTYANSIDPTFKRNTDQW